MNVEKGQKSEKKLFCGVSTIRILGFSPSRNSLNQLLNYTPEEGKEQEEINYIKENVEVKHWNEQGEELDSTFHNQVRVDVWFEESKTKNKNKITFFLVDAIKQTKPKMDDKAGHNIIRTQYINQFGVTFYTDLDLNLPEWFCSL